MKYRRDVDGLRAVAVSAVLLMHGFHSIFPNGFLGVDVFFVISGFVITGSLNRDHPKSFVRFLSDFYARRFLRLLPALVLVLIVSSAVICLFIPRPGDYLKTAVAATFGTANIQLWLAQQDYFSALSDLNPFTHTWSLGVEEQFYLFVPIILWLTKRFLNIEQYFRLMVALSVFSLASWIIVGAHSPDAAFYLMPFRFWELGAGCLIALLVEFRKDVNLGRRNSNNFLLSGELGATSVLIVLLVLLLPWSLPLVPATLIIVFCTCTILFADISGNAVGRVVNSVPVNLVGKASYAIYLWHWPLLVLASWTIGNDPWISASLLMLSVLLGWVSLVLVERPIRYGLEIKNSKAILGGGFLVLFGAAVPALLGTTKPDLFLGKAPVMLAYGVPSLIEPNQDSSGGLWDGSSCVLASDRDVGKEIDPKRCTFGNPITAQRRIIVAGNSYSAAFSQAFPSIAKELDATITLTSSWGASPVPDVENKTQWSKANDYYWQEVIPELTTQLSIGDQVLLLSDLSRFSDISGYPMQSLKELENGLRRFSERMSARGIGVNILGPLPYLRDSQCDPTLASPQWYAPSGGPCIYFSSEDTRRAQSDLRAMLGRLEEESLVKVVEMESIFCPGEICSFFGNEGIILYRDQFSHPSVEAALASADHISRTLRASIENQ